MDIKKIAFTALTVLVTLPLLAQRENDFGTWTAIGLEYEPNKKWELGLEGQFRSKENASVTDEYFVEFEAEREVLDDFDVQIGLRYVRENDNQGGIQGYENHFRFTFDTKYGHKVGDFEIDYRLRYTNKNEFGPAAPEVDFAAQRVRFKASTEYKIKNWKLDPKFAAELFSRFGRDVMTKVDKYRLTLGTEYNLKKAGEIGLSYRLEADIDPANGEALHILMFKYKYSID